MEHCSEVQLQLINYFEKAIEAQPRWVQKLFEKEKVTFIVANGDHIGLKFTDKICAEDKIVIANYFQNYFEENPCEIVVGKEEVLVN